MGTKVNSNYEDLLTFTRASKGHALRPVSYGDELVTNGDFSSTDLSDWSSAINSTATVTSGELVVTGVSASGRQVASISTTVGQVYRLTGEARVSTGSGTALLAISDTTGGLAERGFVTTTETTATNLQLVFVATQSTHYVTAGNGSSGTGNKIFDNISVKEVLFDQPDGTLTLFEHPVNVPRVEWDSAGNRLGLLVEEARTNYNDDSKITSSGWTTVRSSLDRSEGALFLDGTVATRLKEDSSSSNTHHTQDINTLGSSSATFVFSTFVKKPDENSRPYVQLRVSDDPAGANKIYSVLFDLSDGSFLDDGSTGSPSNTFYGSEQYPDGWWRFWCGFTKGGTATRTDTQICLSDTATITAFGNIDTYSGDGVSGLYVAGAQVEQGSFPTSYIKSNSGSTTTRSADVASIPVADFGYNNSNEGSLFVECADISFKAGGTTYPVILQIGNGLNANDRRGFFIAESANQVAAEVISSGVGAAYLALDTHTNGRIESTKLAFRMAENNFAGTDDGTSVVTDTSGTVTPSSPLSIIGIGRNTTGGGHLNGHIKSIKYYPRRLTNAQLVELTS